MFEEIHTFVLLTRKNPKPPQNKLHLYYLETQGIQVVL